MKRNLSEACYPLFSALSNPTRLAILELLRNGPRNVTEISEGLNQEQSMISHNLRPLVRCSLVFSERRKKERFYSLNRETMNPLFKLSAYHNSKFCPAEGKCLTRRNLLQKKKEDALNSFYVTRY